jgi:leucyl-tRNA synthetase
MAYPFTEVESKWQEYWRDQGTFRTRETSDLPSYYVLDMLPYPSGDGLHLGHPIGYTGSDIVARFKRMSGFNVLHPMGWDAFGLPAEQYAVKNKVHPRIATERNVANFRRQLDALGYSYDWSRMINTTDPEYVKWTQWIFLKIYNSYFDTSTNKAKPIEELIAQLESNGTKNLTTSAPAKARTFTAQEWATASSKSKADYLAQFRLAYISEQPVNWCPELGTVLANEEVGEQQEKGFTVVRRNMRQWVLRITAFADRLLADLDQLEWPESTLEMQRNWIGKSVGAEIDFSVLKASDSIKVFTTRPDTLYGATYMVIAPEHPLVKKITTAEQRPAVEKYLDEVKRKSDLERTDLSKSKTGVATGAFAINPANGREIPIWIADYVLISYGTGAIMSVPGHDDRDFEFAETFGLRINRVVSPAGVSGDEPLLRPFHDEGIAVNSGFLNGLTSTEAKGKMLDWLEEKGLGKRSTKFKLRDWLFSRQRYWGEPFPIIYVNEGEGEFAKALPESALPLGLPEVESYRPSGTGESPLATMSDWVNTTDPSTGKPARRETNTMPQWAGSCWYYIRYLDPKNPDAFCDPKKQQEWLPVDLYVGGSEHAVTHLLYSRFWHKMLFDLNYLCSSEPFKRLFHQGLLLGEDGVKMSKSRGNVINPDDLIGQYGADTLRMYLMFLGPLEMMKPWSGQGIAGIHRFLNRIWNLMVSETGETVTQMTNAAPSQSLERVLHQTIKKVGEDIQALRLNTAISSLFILFNAMMDEAGGAPMSVYEMLVKLISPFAPHIAEELWTRLGHEGSIQFAGWPAFDEAKMIENTITLILQVNGKLRDKLDVPRGLSREGLEAFAMKSEKLLKYVAGAEIKKVIVVPDKLVNVVVA